ncbi:MFS transporter [Pseudoalteromonas sp. McH1-42]|uniref:MFS transporter n=1 Tax=Pseudoalteromonas sp. McH1-42 TaxID=2917752 RepID=UPI001EF45E10|nr:MFS transporter [Pseudoalteromonas sp. McH1-42]MCG7562394.1 MFS transporter [Pseudoalteromonas sp. McH1-42]
MSINTPSSQPGPEFQTGNIQHRGFSRAFYVANLMEIFERLAWYGFFAVSSVYMTTPSAQGGVGFTDLERGAVQGIIPFFLYLLPVLTGALGDQLGYRKMFLLSFAIMAPGYYLLGQAQSFWPFFAALSLVALGAACFKPVVVGTISHSTNDSNRGLGFGIFYTMVNIGGFLGPLLAGALRAISWDAVFMMSACWILVNFIPVLWFYRDPPSLKREKASLSNVLREAQSVLGNGRFALTLLVAVLLLMCSGVEVLSYAQAFSCIGLWLVINLIWDRIASKVGPSNVSWWAQPMRVSNVRFALYLAIIAGFWTVYNQLFYTLPLFIRDYVDTRDLLNFIAWFGEDAVSFFAYVDSAQLQKAVQALHTQLQSGTQPTAEALRLEWVHLKVNVPASELSALMAHLQSLEVLTTIQLQQFTSALLAYRQINPEYLINLDFAAIVLLQILVSYLCQRIRPFYVLTAGLVVMCCAFALMAVELTATGGAVIVTVILLIALGEMLTSPKSQEYVASIAPPSQAALYMGYYFVSMALGFLFAGFLSGWSYATLVQQDGRPDLMWALFGGLALLTAIALYLFNRYVIEGSTHEISSAPQTS